MLKSFEEILKRLKEIGTVLQIVPLLRIFIRRWVFQYCTAPPHLVHKAQVSPSVSIQEWKGVPSDI